jgi:hypothetical protein
VKFTTIGMIFVFLTVSSGTSGEELSLDAQRRIIENYMHLTGQRPAPTLALSVTGTPRDYPEKCGTPVILQFQRNYDKFDRGLLGALGPQLRERPQLGYYHDTPGGNIRIYFNVSGSNAAYQAGVDSDGDGAPDYVEAIGLIADSIYSNMVDSMGYPPPIVDSGCIGGGDGRVDIYLMSLPPGYYGATYRDSTCATDPSGRQFPCWVEIDHDFQHLPEYVGRPLDAARVTLAHELFHTSHFAMDATEDIVWFEMSATWMEEELYDDINDYYLLDEYFFNYPTRSIQSVQDAHHYASVFFPIYLTEKYGADIIQAIWLQAALLGPGPDFLLSFDQMIILTSDTTANLNTAFAEFAVWNFFTGPYADQAPNGIGYSEKENYDFIPLDSMDLHRSYPATVSIDDNSFSPQINAATYLRLENLVALDNDSPLGLFAFFRDAVTISWGVSGIFQLESDPDSHLVVTDTVLDWGGGLFIDSILDSLKVDSIFVDSFEYIFEPLLYRPSRYRSATIAFSPTTFNPGVYQPGDRIGLSYATADSSILDQSLVDLPSGVLSPYPNPAVVADMGGAGLTFRFQSPTGESSYPIYGTALLLVDLFTVAGENVRTLEGIFVEEDRTGTYRTGIYEAAWDMRNQAGRDVASGVYLAYARLYRDPKKSLLLAEDRVKIAVIR